MIDLVLEGFFRQPKLDSGGGSSDSAKRHRACSVVGQLAGKLVSAFDEQSQWDRGLVDVVGRSEGAWLLC